MMKTILFFLPLFATEPTAQNHKEILQSIQIAELKTQVSAAKYREAQRLMQDAEAENIKANGEAIAAKVAACKSVGGAVLDDCEYDFSAWKVTKKPAKEQK